MTDSFPLLVLSALVSLALLYWIIQAAVASANKKLHQQLVIHNRLLLEQLRQQGTGEERLKELLDTSRRVTLQAQEA